MNLDRRHLRLILLLTLPMTPWRGLSAQPQVREVGTQLQLFLDDWLVESMEQVHHVLHSPQPMEVAIRMDRPYEDTVLYDPSVIKDGHRYRMWYRTALSKSPHYTGYAESLDGIHWVKPDLGLIEYDGSTRNNIVWPVPGGKGAVLSFFKDKNPAAAASERYKAIGIASEKKPSGEGSRAVFYGMVSGDGLRWRNVQQEPIVRAPLEDPAFDSHNIVLWDQARGHYSIYARGWKRHGVRDIRRFTSRDFRTWSGPRYLDFGDAPIEHLYKNAAIPYYRRPDIILMFPKRFLPERRYADHWKQDGLSDIVFMFSRDGIRFDRRYMEAFLRPGRNPLNWHDRAIEVGPTLVPTGPGEMSLYYVEHYKTPQVRIRRAVLREDGIVSLRGPYAGGSVLTRPLRFRGRELVLNHATSAAGSLRVEIQDASGRTLEGYALEDCPDIYGDEIGRVVSWTGGSDLSPLAGQVVRLKVEIRDGDLYSLRFRP